MYISPLLHYYYIYMHIHLEVVKETYVHKACGAKISTHRAAPRFLSGYDDKCIFKNYLNAKLDFITIKDCLPALKLK